MKASRKLHPDKGGDGDRFRNMNECYKENKDTLSCSEESKITSSIAEKEEVIPEGDTKMEEKLPEIQKTPLMLENTPKEKPPKIVIKDSNGKEAKSITDISQLNNFFGID